MDATSSGQRRPNVVVILADDLGWGDLSCQGATQIHTPNIDELARRGMRFTDAHASSAVCTPSRYSLLTGDYPWRSPLKSGVLGGADPAIIAHDAPTLARDLRDRGYSTGAFGKWHLGLGWTWLDGSTPDAFTEGFVPDMQGSGRGIDYSAPFTGGPTALGFDRFFGIAGSLDMPPYCFLDQDHAVGAPLVEKKDLVSSQRPGLAAQGWRDDAVDTTVTEQAVAWIGEQRRAGQEFFAYIATAAPHRPCVPPAFVHGSTAAGQRGDAVFLVDWMVGRLMEALGDELERTLVVFTSDNGAPTMFTEDMLDADGGLTAHLPNGPWRGQKADAWEAGHRVPLIVAGAGSSAGVCDSLVSLLDIRATVRDVTESAAGTAVERSASGDAGGSPADHDDGESFAALLTGEQCAEPDRLLGHQAFDGTLVLRNGPIKAIYGTGSGGFSAPQGQPDDTGRGPGQLFDLSTDPVESDNIWSKRTTDAHAMIDTFEQRTGFTRGTR
ncbi:sulfatase family protein [Paenarthrobacter histidinolovorans]|uniref:Arylsulfatase A n=1 Tax=Paenarthrobacter histidinolovorans TaxID=43664 RepID=A0ABW8NCI5_9MICC